MIEWGREPGAGGHVPVRDDIRLQGRRGRKPLAVDPAMPQRGGRKDLCRSIISSIDLHHPPSYHGELGLSARTPKGCCLVRSVRCDGCLTKYYRVRFLGWMFRRHR